MDLTGARARLLALLADADGTAGWLDAVLDEALRRGLRSYTMQGPVDEVTVTVSADGYGLDIAGLQALTVYAVAPGWVDGVRLEAAALASTAWRMIGDGEIRADGYAFAVGEQVRIRYRRRHTLEGLDGATETSVSNDRMEVVLLGAAHHAYLLRLREMSRRPSAPKAEVGACEYLSETYWTQFVEACAGLGARVNPVWRVGV